MATRYINADVKRHLDKKHHFECAWCGVQLFERHHIKHYSAGGANTEENLILLCSNCHTAVHKGEIDAGELKKRKTTHMQGDRFSGNLSFDSTVDYFDIGGNIVRRCPVIIQVNEVPVIRYETDAGGNILFSFRFYSKVGALILWMEKNRYWTNSNFTKKETRNSVEIESEEEGVFFKFVKKGNVVFIRGANYCGGIKLLSTDEGLLVGTNSISGSNFSDSPIGLIINT